MYWKKEEKIYKINIQLNKIYRNKELMNKNVYNLKREERKKLTIWKKEGVE